MIGGCDSLCDAEGAIRLVFPAEPFEVRAALSRLFDTFPDAAIDEDLRSSTLIVVSEVLNNVVEHAYADQIGEVILTLLPIAGGIMFEICDYGRPMPDGRPPSGQLPQSGADGLPEGGFGWYLIRTLARDVRYARVGRLNRLSFALMAEQSAPVRPTAATSATKT